MTGDEYTIEMYMNSTSHEVYSGDWEFTYDTTQFTAVRFIQSNIFEMTYDNSIEGIHTCTIIKPLDINGNDDTIGESIWIGSIVLLVRDDATVGDVIDGYGIKYGNFYDWSGEIFIGNARGYADIEDVMVIKERISPNVFIKDDGETYEMCVIFINPTRFVGIAMEYVVENDNITIYETGGVVLYGNNRRYAMTSLDGNTLIGVSEIKVMTAPEMIRINGDIRVIVYTTRKQYEYTMTEMKLQPIMF